MIINEGDLCPHCKKGKMRERMAVVSVNEPDRANTTELICDICRHRIVNVDAKDTLKFDDKIKTKKKPS